MTTDAEKRKYVLNLYSAKRWKRMVAAMSDQKVAAIYRDHKHDPTPKPKAHYRDLPEELVPRPTDWRELISSRPKLANHPPHENEDDFPLI